MYRLLAVLFVFLNLAACQAVTPKPSDSHVTVQPKTPVVKNITNFTNSLRCMDDLFYSYSISDIIITSDGIPDKTGQISAGTKEMMISAISKMSTKSGAFKFVDVDRQQDSVFWIQQNWIGVREGLLAPKYYIRGAITQVDTGVDNASKSAGFSLPFLSLGLSKDQLVSLVSMDLNVGDIVTRQILAGHSSTNSIAVVRTGKGGDTEGLIKKAGLFFEVSRDQSEGSHQSVRTLVELGMIEVLGKLSQVPYWRCLNIESTNPEMMDHANDWYRTTPQKQLITAVKKALKKHGTYYGSNSPNMNQELQEAIVKYKVENDLIPNNEINFELYYSLLTEGLLHYSERVTINKLNTNQVEKTISSNPVNDIATTESGGLDIYPEGGKNREFNAGEELRFIVAPKGDMYIHCYYKDHRDEIVKIFPNRFSSTDLIEGGKWITVPSRSAGFSIYFEKPKVNETIACIGFKNERISTNINHKDLTPLNIRSINEIIDQYKRFDRYNTSVEILKLRVN